jgi:hypothetical protein
MEALSLCTEDDLKEGGLPLGPRKKLLKFLEDRKRAREGDGVSGFEKFTQVSDVIQLFCPEITNFRNKLLCSSQGRLSSLA